MTKTQIYRPDNSIRQGYKSIFAEIYQELAYNKWLTWQLFKRDFFALYKQSFLGLFWAFFIPLLSVGTFIVLRSSGVFASGEMEVPYPLYAVFGISFWQLFATGLLGCSQSLAAAGQMITKINFSKKSLVLAGMGKGAVSFLIQLALVFVLFFVYGVKPSLLGILILPIVLAAIMFLTFGIGFLLALINGIMRDISSILPTGLTFMMFLTPILYAKPQSGFVLTLTKFNPMYYFISAARDLVFTGRITELTGFLYSLIFSVVLFMGSLVIFHLTETRIAERV